MSANSGANSCALVSKYLDNMVTRWEVERQNQVRNWLFAIYFGVVINAGCGSPPHLLFQKKRQLTYASRY